MAVIYHGSDICRIVVATGQADCSANGTCPSRQKSCTTRTECHVQHEMPHWGEAGGDLPHLIPHLNTTIVMTTLKLAIFLAQLERESIATCKNPAGAHVGDKSYGRHPCARESE